MSRGRRTVVVFGLAMLVAGAAAGCSYDNEVAHSTRRAVEVPEATAPVAASTTPCTPVEQAAFDSDLRGEGFASLPPLSPMPAPGAMPVGSTMAEIAARGRLVVGVDQNTLQFGYRDRDGNLDGLDVELVRAVARAIFGGDNVDDHISYRAVTTAQRIPAVKNHEVDVLASLLTVTCDRARDVGLSSVYYLAHQRFLVRADSGIVSVADLAGKRVCATAGSTTLAHLADIAPQAEPHAAAARTDCLVALQERTVDAITADDTILRSFQAQDPKTVLLPGEFSDEPYAMAVAADRPDLLRFSNGVLDQMRADGRLAALATEWIGAESAASIPLPRYR